MDRNIYVLFQVLYIVNITMYNCIKNKIIQYGSWHKTKQILTKTNETQNCCNTDF